MKSSSSGVEDLEELYFRAEREDVFWIKPLIAAHLARLQSKGVAVVTKRRALP